MTKTTNLRSNPAESCVRQEDIPAIKAAPKPRKPAQAAKKSVSQVEANMLEVAQEILAGDKTNLETLQHVIQNSVSTMPVHDPLGLLGTKSTVAAPATASVAAQLAAAVPQIAANQAEKPVKAAKTPDLKLVIVKQFRPRTNQLVSKKADGHGNFAQENNWDALVKAIHAHGGAISYADAVAAVEAAGKAGGYAATCNARGFVQGRVRNGHVKAA